MGLSLVGLLSAGGCDDEAPAGPGTLRFGQIGRLRVELTTPLQFGLGELEQSLTWESSGPWTLTETIRYRGLSGDESLRRSSQLPEVLAGSYATWIAQVNDVQSLSLFIDELEPDGDPPPEAPCPPGRSRLVLSIRDVSRGEEISWTRCVVGRLANLTTAGAGPDGAAARVAAAVILARDYALGETFQSAYAGSVPFGTIEKGEDSGLDLTQSFVLTEPDAWAAFWAQHRGQAASTPAVDFDEDMVIVAAVGLRLEAGDSVEIRRVLPVGDATFVQRVERVPGDFCSPAEKDHYPFHIILTPAVPLPVQFVEPVAVERVPCGG